MSWASIAFSLTIFGFSSEIFRRPETPPSAAPRTAIAAQSINWLSIGRSLIRSVPKLKLGRLGVECRRGYDLALKMASMIASCSPVAMETNGLSGQPSALLCIRPIKLQMFCSGTTRPLELPQGPGASDQPMTSFAIASRMPMESLLQVKRTPVDQCADNWPLGLSLGVPVSEEATCGHCWPLAKLVSGGVNHRRQHLQIAVKSGDRNNAPVKVGRDTTLCGRLIPRRPRKNMTRDAQ